MKKNVAGQKIGAQMVSATDGSAFAGAVTVYVCGDAGAQAIGSVGAGACTHEGNGYHTYAPAQAETNYDLIAFTFIGTGAVPSTVQVESAFPQTGDNYARLGVPNAASIAADIAAVAAKTNALSSDPADASDIAAAFASLPNAAAVAAAVLAAAAAAPISVDVKRQNATPVIGTGTAGDKWRGAP